MVTSSYAEADDVSQEDLAAAEEYFGRMVDKIRAEDKAEAVAQDYFGRSLTNKELNSVLQKYATTPYSMLKCVVDTIGR